MEYTRKAIQKAVENGWSPIGLNVHGKPLAWIRQAAISRSKFIERYLMDPLFWQALGRGLGWEEMNESNKFIQLDEYRVFVGYWEYQWHFLIDHLADGGTVEDFFKGIIK